jgi:hypothetical protein
MIKTAAVIFGVAFLIAGLLGFVPAASPDGMLLGLLHVNPAHNVVHLLTGALALWAGMTSVQTSRMFFKAFGVVYGLVAMLGFFYGDRPILGLVANNIADAWFHLFVAAISLYLGLGPADIRRPHQMKPVGE